jgi:3-oxocholest-4-en-26-oate---CoA ligase
VRPELSIADVHEALATAIPEREAVVFRDRRLTFAQWNARTRRLGHYLRGLGLGCHTERNALAGWASGQDHLALYLYNGNEYLEGMLGAYKARVAPFNVNYRYVDDELIYLLNNARARAVLFHAEFAPRLAAIRDRVPTLEHFIQVTDDSGQALLPGAVEYEAALAASSADPVDSDHPRRPLHSLHRRHHGHAQGRAVAPVGHPVCRARWRCPRGLDSLVAAAQQGGMRMLPAAPFMHGAGHWIAFTALHGGHTCVIQNDVKRLDPQDIWRVCERERVNFLQIVGDAFGRPLLDELECGRYDLSALKILLSGGAPLNAALKAQFLEHVPAPQRHRRARLVGDRRAGLAHLHQRDRRQRPAASRRGRTTSSSTRP